MMVPYHTVLCPNCNRIDRRVYSPKEGPPVIEPIEVGYGPNLKPWSEAQGLYEPEAVGQRLDEDYCSDCLYWMGIYAHKDSHRSIRINNEHYWLYDMKTDGSGFLPFGGRQFEIRRKGFENIEIVMMWYNAEIPEALREDLYNNAEFVK